MKNSHNRNRNRINRKPLLSSIGLAVVATLIASGAHAAGTSYEAAPESEVVNGNTGLALLQQNSDTVGAEVRNSSVYQNDDATSATSGGNAGLIGENTVGARAIGNDFDNSIGLALINTTTDPQAGSGMLSRSINSGGGISSLVDSNTLTISDVGTDSTASSFAITNNTISADTFGNRGASLIAGTVPSGFTSAIDGSSAMLMGDFTAAGGIVVTSAQATSANASADAFDNAITLQLTSTDVTDANAQEAGAVLTGNAITATARGNRASSAISIESGDKPSFTGSAVVSNLQSVSADATAQNLNSTINAVVDSDELSTNTLQGALAVNNNTISSAATGNDALGSSTAAGNRILIADTMSFAGAATPSPGSTLASDGSGGSSAADLVIHNLQTATGATISSTTDTAQVLATVDALNGGSIDLSGNRITASANGNAASSALSNGSGTASFVGSVALASQQSNTDGSITAANDYASLIANSNGNVNAATVSVADNISSATARGNQVSQSLVLNANELTLGGTGAATLTGNDDAATEGAATVSNLQNNIGSPVSASMISPYSEQFAGNVTDSTLSVTGNLQEAMALGNNASNAIALSGNIIGAGAGILNVQLGEDSAVSASVDDAYAYMRVNDVSGSTLNLRNNDMSAMGYGNLVTNALNVNATDFAADFAAGSDAAAELTGDVVSTLATGAAVVSNLQTQDSTVSALVSNGYSRINVNDNVANSTLSNTNNLQEARALGNSASNAIALSGGTLGAGAGLLSVQRGETTTTATLTDNDVSIEVDYGDITGSTFSVSSNAQRAIGYGNSVSNALSVAANDFAAGSAVATLSGDEATGVTALGAAVVSNLQTQAGTVSAINSGAITYIETESEDDFYNNTLTLTGNSQEAMALRNSASNTLSVTGTTLGAGAGLVSVQVGNVASTVEAVLGNADIQLNNDYDSAAASTNTLDVSNNAQRAVGYGNSASNMLTLGANDIAGGAAAKLSASTSSVDATGAATLSNLQTQAASVDATNETTIDGSGIRIRTVGDDVTNSTLAVTGNTQEAMALGNNANNALKVGGSIVDTAAGSVGQGIGLVSAQSNSGAPVTATLTDAAAYGYISHDTRDSTVSVSDNAQRATGYGNSVSNLLSVNANDFAAGSSAAELSADGSTLAATGAATLSNLQQQTGTSVLANNTGSNISMATDDPVYGSTLTVAGNTQEAMALGSSASNALTLTGNTLGAGAGIVNAQRGDDATSTVTATLQNAGVGVDLNGYSAVDSTLSVSNNLQRAIGYGNSATNALSVSANDIGVVRTGTTPSVVSAVDSAAAPSVLAGYGVLNTQSVLADVDATTTSADNVGATQITTGSATSSILLNEDNALVAAAYGNESSSRLDLLNVNSINAGDPAVGFASVANITSTQAVDAAISAMADGQAAASTTVDGVLLDGKVSTSGNAVNAQAIGNLADNLLNVAGAGNISTAVTGTTGTLANATVLNTNASFSVQNVQTGAGTVMATHRDNALSTEVRVDIGGDVTNSSVFADRNSSTASATSNSAFNTLGLAAGNVASSSAVQNVQSTSADVDALIGAAAAEGTPSIEFRDYPTASGSTKLGSDVESSYSTGTKTLTVNAGKSVVFSTAEVSGATKTALESFLKSLGFVIDSNEETATASGGISGQDFVLTSLQGFDTTNPPGSISYTFTGFAQPAVDATPGTPARGGVLLAVGADVIGSTLSVADNVTNGSAAGNRAVNRSILTGNDVGSGSTLTSATTSLNETTAIATTAADHVLSNLQTSESGRISSTVGGAFAIDAQPGVDISNATLRVSGNSQTATARGNTATNELALQGNSLTSTLALQSTQIGSTALDAVSTLNLYAPADVTNSSVTISDNVNTARAVLNNASNSLSVSGTNVGNDASGSISSDVLTPQVTSITAEQVLANHQSATGVVSSEAVTTLYNQARYSNATASLVDSTLNVTGNATQAVALANQALNVATVSGGTQAASVALSNSQDSIQSVTAVATTTANVTLRGVTEGALALNNSSVMVGGNNTTALAAGNYADNVLNSLGSNAYGTASGGSVNLVTAGLSVEANAGILNRQSNSGAVEARSEDATYMVALNAGVSNSSVNMTGNRVAAEAYGNSVTNRMTLDALNTGNSTAAVGNYQSNSGAISATVSSVVYGVGFSGANAIVGSTARTTGNQITATAVGNSSVSSILAAVR